MEHGPIVILGRPHSGTRLLAGLLQASGVFLGANLTIPQLDSWSIHQRFIVPLLHARLAGEHSDVDLERIAQVCWTAAWLHDGGVVREGRAWGWKCCETSFVMPEVRRLLPTAVFIHLVRDGRNVILTDRGYFQLTAPTSNPPGWQAISPPRAGEGAPGTPLSYRDFCRLVTFGKPEVRRWRGIALDNVREVIANRYLLQMRAWMTAVIQARRDGAALGGGYHEVRYEDLCAYPTETVRALFRQLGLPSSDQGIAHLRQRVVPARAGGWRQVRLSGGETRDFARARDYADSVLREFGYGD